MKETKTNASVGHQAFHLGASTSIKPPLPQPQDADADASAALPQVPSHINGKASPVSSLHAHLLPQLCLFRPTKPDNLHALCPTHSSCTATATAGHTEVKLPKLQGSNSVVLPAQHQNQEVWPSTTERHCKNAR